MSTTPDFGHNAWAEQKRLEKAVALETQLVVDGIPVDAARTLPAAARRRVERAAGVRPSSDETWARVFQLMDDRERVRAMVAERAAAADAREPFCSRCGMRDHYIDTCPRGA